MSDGKRISLVPRKQPDIEVAAVGDWKMADQPVGYFLGQRPVKEAPKLKLVATHKTEGESA